MSELPTTIMQARTFLFVPGDRPDRFSKAAASGADAMVIDLEDAVAAEDRDQARSNVQSWLEAGHEVVVRVNAFGDPDHDKDIAALRGHTVGVMLAKADAVVALQTLTGVLGQECPIIALIESASGILAAAEIAATPGVARLAFGSIDYAAELGVEPTSREAMAFARGALVVASAAAGISPPIDGVTTAITPTTAVSEDVRYGRSIGFAGKLCIHPSQIEPVHRAYTPSDEDVEWATRVVDASKRGAVTQLDGAMVDLPVVLRARRILVDAGRR